MKYAIIIPDGCADQPIEALGGKTPLQAAKIPNMDRVASLGMVAQTDNVSAHLPAGSEVANMTLFGYDPNVYFTGRAPIEAAAQGIELGPNDWAIRCNLVTVIDQIMVDFTADHISTEEAKKLLRSLVIRSLTRVAVCPRRHSYRNLLIYRGSKDDPAPFNRRYENSRASRSDDLPVTDDFPRGPGSDLLTEIMQASVPLFADHPVNQQRTKDGTARQPTFGCGGKVVAHAAFVPRAFRIERRDDYCGRSAPRARRFDRLGSHRSRRCNSYYLDTNYAGKALPCCGAGQVRRGLRARRSHRRSLTRRPARRKS